MHKEFEVNKVNYEGLVVMEQITILFDNVLTALERLKIENCREMSIVKTKLEEACFFAKKSIAPKYTI